MEFIVGTEEYMYVEPVETSGIMTGTFEALATTATYSVYKDDMPLVDANSVILDRTVNRIDGNIFKCMIDPDETWVDSEYALYMKITGIPGFVEKPRFGPFRFRVVT